MKWEYAAVLLIVLLGPLLMSRDPKIRIRTNLPTLALALTVVCIPYWVWDVMATRRGHWSFHPERVSGLSLLGMPVEEWLFFPVVVFVSIFTWESVRYFLRRKG
jgi:lycopene cyclase domain-containing protein